MGLRTRQRHRTRIRRQRTGRDCLFLMVAFVLGMGWMLVLGHRPASGNGRSAALYPTPAPDAQWPIGQGIKIMRMVIEPENGSRSLVRAIDAAMRTIFLSSYILTSRPVIRALERASNQGVDVYVLLEPHPFGMGGQPRRVADELRAAGVAVRWSPPQYLLSHAKYLVLDDRSAVVSSANFSRSAFTRNRDFLLFLADHVGVRQLSVIFRADWNRTRAAITDPDIVVSPTNARLVIANLIHRARVCIDVYAEEVADEGAIRYLTDAVRRRIRERLVLAAGATRAAASRLARAGVTVRTVSAPYIHAKVILIDGRLAFVGSENLSTQSLDANREVGMLTKGDVVARIERVFAQDWSRGQTVT